MHNICVYAHIYIYKTQTQTQSYISHKYALTGVFVAVIKTVTNSILGKKEFISSYTTQVSKITQREVKTRI